MLIPLASPKFAQRSKSGHACFGSAGKLSLLRSQLKRATNLQRAC